MILLATDGTEYGLLLESVQAVADVPGLTCEIGVRAGGSSHLIMQASPPARVHIGIDPWGALPFSFTDTLRHARHDYDNIMRRRCFAELYQWAAFEKRDLHLFTLTDADFFARFGDGVPLYRNGACQLVNEYALVYFDGPHSTPAVQAEVDFFGPRSPVGAAWVFDNYSDYRLPDLSRWGFQEVQRDELKISFRRAT